MYAVNDNNSVCVRERGGGKARETPAAALVSAMRVPILLQPVHKRVTSLCILCNLSACVCVTKPVSNRRHIISTTMSPCILLQQQQQQQAYTGMCKSRGFPWSPGFMRRTHHNLAGRPGTTTQHCCCCRFFVGIGGARWHQTPFVKTLFYCLLALRGQRQRPTVPQPTNVVDNSEYVVHSMYMCHAFYGAIPLINNKAAFNVRRTLTCCALRRFRQNTPQKAGEPRKNNIAF